MAHHVLHDALGENAKLRISDAYLDALVAIEGRCYDRDEVAAALGLFTKEDRDAWKDRAERAEEALGRVRGVCDELTMHGPRTAAQMDRIRAAAHLRPAFVLPTEVPARIEAKRDGETYTFYLWTNGSGGSNDLIWVDENDWTHSPSPKRLMKRFTDHRLIEAGENRG